MPEYNLPRALTPAEVAQIKANTAANKAIFEAANWFVPVPDGRAVSPLGNKSVAYVDEALVILDENADVLGTMIDAAKFHSADAIHDQAQEIEDAMIDVLTAPTNVSLLAGAVAKKYADDEYNVLKGMERLNTKWKAAVERLSERYKGQGKRTDLPK